MTVTNVSNRVEESGNDVKVAFDFNFKIFDEGDINVYKVDNTTQIATLQTIITDYVVAFSSEDQTGTVTYVTAPTSGQNSLIISNFPVTQETDFPTASNFPEIAIENEFDKSRLIDQQLSERIDRSVLLPVQSDLTGLEIPVSTANAGKAIVVNDTGDNLDVRTLLESPQVDVITTRGDLIKGDTLGGSERLGIGASGTFIKSDGLDPSWGSLDNATESVAGVAEIATQAEADAAVDDTRIVTPLKAGLLAKPVFRAYLSSPQSITSGVITKVQYDTEVFDNNSWYDNVTNYRYTPQRAGYYHFTVKSTIDNLTATDQFVVFLYKNGVKNDSYGRNLTTGESDIPLKATSLVFMNGTTDYIEGYAFHNFGSNRNIRAGDDFDTWFAGFYIGG
jgi:hypothetical protein